MIYRGRGEGPREDEWLGPMVEWSRKCVRERGRGEETRVKVVIDGRPGLRPLPYIGQGACLCRCLPALLPSIPVFIFPSTSPTQCYSTGSDASLIHFIHSLYSSPPLSPSFWHPPPSFQLLTHSDITEWKPYRY